MNEFNIWFVNAEIDCHQYRGAHRIEAVWEVEKEILQIKRNGLYLAIIWVWTLAEARDQVNLYQIGANLREFYKQ